MTFNKYTKMLELAKIKHASQTRNNGKVPYWHHCLSVSEIINDALNATKELAKKHKIRNDIILAAIGHDLYEDTDITRKQIINEFNTKVDEYIWSVSNFDGDQNRQQYITKLQSVSEEAMLIKLGDFIDNCLSCAYGIHDLGIEWTSNVFLPIITDLYSVLQQYTFIKYPNTSKYLIELSKFSYQRLIENYNKYE